MRAMTQSEFHHLLSSVKALSPGQMRQLRQEIDSELSQKAALTGEPKKPRARTSGRASRSVRAPLPPAKKPMTEEEFDQHMLEIGLMSQLPDTAADHDDPEAEPISIKGEPLSATVVRERR